ncbi:hypothetical protein YC2023_093409 [Brassica napus]
MDDVRRLKKCEKGGGAYGCVHGIRRREGSIEPLPSIPTEKFKFHKYEDLMSMATRTLSYPFSYPNLPDIVGEVTAMKSTHNDET